jgi:hypothetical protein
MFVGYAIIAVLLSAALVVSAVGKLRRMEQVVTMITGLGVPIDWFPMLAAAEIAGAVGLLIGLAVPVIGILAAIGVIAYFVGAVIAHLRAGDRQIVPPAALGVFAVIALVLRAGSI